MSQTAQTTLAHDVSFNGIGCMLPTKSYGTAPGSG